MTHASHKKNITSLIKKGIKQKDPSASVILFGSCTRGDATKDSDWDILVLLERSKVNRFTEKEFRDELFEVQLETGEPISTFVFSKSDWEIKHSATPLYENIQRDGISLYWQKLNTSITGLLNQTKLLKMPSYLLRTIGGILV